MINVADNLPGRFGWLENPMEVERIMKSLPKPLFGTAAPALIADEKKEINLATFFRKVIGKDAPKGPQGIGDCVSWGWSNFGNYLQATQIMDRIASHEKDLIAEIINVPEPSWSLDLKDLIRTSRFEYQEIATEAMYGLSRVEVGGQHNSYSDGSVGAWAAKAAEQYGFLSRKQLEEAGLSPAYDPQRAKQWGAKGLPDELEPLAKLHTCKVVSKVNTFSEAAAAIQNFQPVPVCSSRGFTMTRDNQGFCTPKGVWYHCMVFMAVRWDRPGLLCSQSWGPNTPNGPLDKDQPDNTFWVDAKVCDAMLGYGDSFTGNTLAGYIKRDWVDWSF